MPNPTGNDVVTLSEILNGKDGASETHPVAAFDPGQIGDDLDIPDDLALAQTFAQIGEEGSDYTVFVYQIPSDRNSKDVYLYRCSVSEFATNGLDDIRDSYGPGDYRIRVMKGSRVHTHRRVSIGAGLKKKNDVIPVTAGNNADILALIQRQGDMFMAGLQRIADLARPQSNGMGVQETIALISTLQPLINPAAQAPADPIEQLTKLVALQKSLGLDPNKSDKETNGDDLLLEGLKTFGRPIAEIVQRGLTQAPGLSHTQALPASVAVPVAAPARVTKPEEEESEMQIMMRAYKAVILQAAKHNQDPGPFAEIVEQNFKPEELEKYIYAENWLEQLATLIPECRQYPGWFDQLRQYIIADLQDAKKPGNVAANT